MFEYDIKRKPVLKPVTRCVGILTAFSIAVISGCAAVPSDGPVASKVEGSASKDSEVSIPKVSLVFDVIQVDQRVANNVTQLGQPSLASTFGFGGATATPLIGVGDVLSVTIFEAGPDGLFSTNDHKSTTIPVVVQPDGHGQIPYVGAVKFVGLTLEQARQSIVNSLKAKAVEPDVIVNMTDNASRTVSVQGAVARSTVIPLSLGPAPITRAIAGAGGPVKSPYDTYVSLTRGNKVGTVLLQAILENPKDDINLRPGDKVFLTYDPRTFSALGAGFKASKIPLESGEVSLIEAAALSGGPNSLVADPKGYFIFRYEYEAVYRQVAGADRFRELLSQGMMANKDGLYPIVYRIDMADPQNYIVAQSFPIRNKDVLYISHHPSVDFAKFITLITGPVRIYRDIDAITKN